MILSTLSTKTIEAIAEEARREYQICRLQNPDHPKPLLWYQLYIYKDREITYQLIRRAEEAGCSALVVTVDTPLLGRREADLRHQFALSSHLSLANFDRNIHELDTMKTAFKDYIKQQFDSSITWDNLQEVVQGRTHLPVLLKGIYTPEDAQLAIAHRVQGIIVSNHGGRQLDTTEATLEILPRVVKAVNASGGDSLLEIYVDGGIRRGSDIFKALALGARGVFIGRPVLWGLACEGDLGVEHILTILKEELSITMALCGCTSLSDLHPSLVVSSTHE
jgi:(S)-2-hydroxy-acid oxidase